MKPDGHGLFPFAFILWIEGGSEGCLTHVHSQLGSQEFLPFKISQKVSRDGEASVELMG
jgi:hypothetical protein